MTSCQHDATVLPGSPALMRHSCGQHLPRVYMLRYRQLAICFLTLTPCIVRQSNSSLLVVGLPVSDTCIQQLFLPVCVNNLASIIRTHLHWVPATLTRIKLWSKKHRKLVYPSYQRTLSADGGVTVLDTRDARDAPSAFSMNRSSTVQIHTTQSHAAKNPTSYSRTRGPFDHMSTYPLFAQKCIQVK